MRNKYTYYHAVAAGYAGYLRVNRAAEVQIPAAYGSQTEPAYAAIFAAVDGGKGVEEVPKPAWIFGKECAYQPILHRLVPNVVKARFREYDVQSKQGKKVKT